MVSLIALLWGFAEATIFFIIPDVFLSYIAMTEKNIKKVSKVLILTFIGALAGGIIIYLTAKHNPDIVKNILLAVPSVQPYMLEHVEATMNNHPFTGLISGPIFGVPYKLFAFEAPNHMSLPIFIIVSIPARLSRFILVSILAYYLSHYLCKILKYKTKLTIWLIVWIFVYTIYFSIHGI